MGTTALTVQQKAITLRDELFSRKEQFAAAMPEWMTVDRLLRIVFTTTMKNPKLLDCTKESLFGAIMQCGQLGLEPILGRAYLIPYNNSKYINNKWVKVMECQFQPGYQGLIDLARRSNTISDVQARNVYNNDDFDLSFEKEIPFHHRPWFMTEKRSSGKGELLGSYANWILKDGTKHFEFMYVDDIHKRRGRSQAYQYAMAHPDNKNAQDCPWIQWPEEMTVKTVIKHSSKIVPASIEFMEAVQIDNDAEMGLIPRISSDGGMNDFSFDQLGSGPKPEEQFSALIEENSLDKEKVNEFLSKAMETYGATRDTLISQALEDEVGFINQLNIFIEGSKGSGKSASGTQGNKSQSSPGTGKEPPTFESEIGGLKTPGLTAWEKKNHDDIEFMSPSDRKFFLNKWQRTIKEDYYSEGQPGYKKDADPEDFASAGNPEGETHKASGENGTDDADARGKRIGMFQARMMKHRINYPEIYAKVFEEKALPSDIREIPEDLFDDILTAIEREINLIS